MDVLAQGGEAEFPTAHLPRLLSNEQVDLERQRRPVRRGGPQQPLALVPLGVRSLSVLGTDYFRQCALAYSSVSV